MRPAEPRTQLSLHDHWEDWLAERYASLANADSALGNHALPTDAALCADAPSVSVAAFRRFLDDHISDGYRRVRTSIRAVDPNHLIGARSGYGGNGSQYICPAVPFDLRSGVKNVDIISPEGYALSWTSRQNVLDRGGFTGAYSDVGKPIFWAEYGVNADGVSCGDCTATVQRDYFINMLNMMERTGANGGAGWWYVGTRPQSTRDSEVSDFGIIHDYARYATSVDAAGTPMRDGWLALCTATPQDHGLYVVYDDATAVSYACPAGTTGRGTFKPGYVPLGIAATASDPVGHETASGWLSLCGTSDDAVLAVTYNDYTATGYSCPAGTTAAGAFKVGGVALGAGMTGVDTLGRSIESGWMTLCVKNSAALLGRVHSGLSGRDYACPAGTFANGRFKPDIAPTERPVVAAVRTRLATWAPDTTRAYTTWITVDRDAHAGDWKMYDDGTAAWAAAASGGSKVGVKTPCTGTTSKSTQLCVGNTPNTGSCPAKCLNADWNAVEVLNRDNVWTRVADHQAVDVAGGRPIRVRLSAGNTGEGTWLTTTSAGGTTGTVRFGCNENFSGAIGCRIDIPRDTPFLHDADSGEVTLSPGVTASTPVVFQMLSENVAWFGDQVHVTLAP